MPTIRIRVRWAIAVSAVVASLLIFPYLGSTPFWDYDEGIYARITHDTHASGNSFLLQHMGQPFFEKPPLYFWTSMGLDALLHAPEWSYRLTSAIAGVACVIAVVLLAWEMSGSALVALLSGLILATTGAFIEAAREMRLDVPTVAAIIAATYCFTRGRRDERWLMGVGIAVAIGFLFKSVIALLAGVYVLTWSITRGDWSWIRSRAFWLGAGIGFALLVPWHVYESLHFGGAFWDGYLWHNVVGRVSSDVLGGTQTIGEMIRFCFAFGAPWSIILVLTALFVCVGGDPRRRTRDEQMLFISTLTAVVIIALFTASSTRIFYYLLPAYPFVAIAVALAAREVARRAPVALAYAVIIALLAAGSWVTYNYAWHRFGIMHTGDLIAADEKAAAVSIADEPMDVPVYAYAYDYWDTFGYYSGRTIAAMTDDAVLDRPFFLVVSTPFMQGHSFDPELAKHLTPRYQGPVVTLFEFRP